MMNRKKLSGKKIAWTLVALLLAVTYIILLVVHTDMYLNGQTSILSTFVFYVALTLIVLLVITGLSLFVRFIRQRRHKFFLFSITLFSLLFLVELFLKFILGTHQGYLEKNGSFFYFSYYRQIDQENRRYNKGTRKEKVWYWFHMPNGWWKDSKPEFSYFYQMNSAGFRDREFSAEKAPGEFRIITVGDSYTEGVGAPQDSTYPRLLENKLRTYYPDKNIRVCNCGVSGSDPFYEFILVRDKLMKYSPDLVILGTNASDIQDINVRGGMERFRSDGTVKYTDPPAWEPLYCVSYICRHIIHDICGYNWMFVKNDELERVNLLSIIQIKSAADRLLNLSKAHKFRTLVVLAPTRYEVETDYFPLKQLPVGLAKNDSAGVLNLNEYFVRKGHVNRSNSLNYFWPIDGHNNSRGYELFAKGVAEKIIDMGWISAESAKK